MEPSKEPICVRVSRLNKLFLSHASVDKSVSNLHCLGREGLYDALVVLYDECNNDALKKDRSIEVFVDKFRGLVAELRKLRVNLTDFEVKKVIGRGHFGEVQVVREKQTGNVYAMKTLRKSQTLNQNSVAFYQEERDIMAHAASPWITSLQYAFQDLQNLYLVMEFHPGGDLLALLDRFDGSLSEDLSRFYLAELVLAIRSLHCMGYVHRDIKPENILIDLCGHLKLADFGSAARLSAAGMVRSYLPVGTPDYIAPEVLLSMEGHKNSNSYGIECDYWSLGIVAYEMVVGKTPFSEEDVVNKYSNIMNHQGKVEIPRETQASSQLRELVSGLLQDVSTRLGHEQLLKHSFFYSIDWGKLRETVPPYIPSVMGEDDTSNFVEFEPEPPTISIGDFKVKKEFSGQNLPFIGFSYTHEIVSEDKHESISSPRNDSFDAAEASVKNKEIELLRQKLREVEKHNGELTRNVPILEERCKRLEANVSELEYHCEKVTASNEALKRTACLERAEWQANEKKVISLIRDTKAKWQREHEEKTAELRHTLEGKEKQLTDLCTQNNVLTSQVHRANEELEAKVSEVKELQAEVEKSRSNVVKVCKQTRHSVVGMESRLERVLNDNQRQLSVLQKELSTEKDLRAEVETKFRDAIEACSSREKELSDEVDKIQTANEQLLYKLEVAAQKCSELECNVKFWKEKSEETSELNSLRHKLKTEKSKSDDLSTKLKLQEDNVSYLLTVEQELICERSHVVEIQKELRLANEGRMKLQHDLGDAVAREEAVSEKLYVLEDLVKNLQQGLLRLEEENVKLKEKSKAISTVENDLTKDLMQQKTVLESQVEKLEAQLEKLRESSILDRDAARNVQSQLWKLEKEMADLKIDLRIAQREAKAAESAVKVLEEEKKKIGEQLLSENSEHAAILREMTEKNDALREQLSKCQDDLQNLRVDGEKYQLRIRELTKDSDSLRTVLKKSQNEETSQALQIKQLQEACSRLQCDLTLSTQENERTSSSLKDEMCRSRTLQENYEHLKGACVTLDEQLEEFAQIIKANKESEGLLKTEKCQLQKDLDSRQQDLQAVRITLNEEKSHRIKAEKKCEMLESELQSQKETNSMLEGQVTEYKEMAKNLTDQVAELSEESGQVELQLKTAKRKIEGLLEENNLLREEVSQRLTQIHGMRESIYQMDKDLEGAAVRIKDSDSRIAELHAKLEEIQVSFKYEELKAESKMKQQEKLIFFLQSSMEKTSKKKKTFTDKLFGGNIHKQKENVPPLALTRELEELRSQVRSLTSQLASAKRNGSTFKDTTATSQTKNVLSQLTQSPASQYNSLGRRASAPRMHHNIPHRIETKHCMQLVKCFVCTEIIPVGRQVSVCLECNLTVHPKCSLVLPKTCGLPAGFAHQFSKTLQQSSSDGCSDVVECSTENMEGYVKLLLNGCWKNKFIRLSESAILIFNEKPNAENNIPDDRFEVCPPGGISKIVQAVSHTELPSTATCDIPFILKLEVKPRRTCWPSSSLYIMTPGEKEKEYLVQSLQTVINSNQLPDRQAAVVLSSDKTENLEFNCCISLSDKVLLLGANNGLHSVNLKGTRNGPVHIQGVTHVYQMEILPDLKVVIMICGENRSLMLCNLPQLLSSAQSLECSAPVITAANIMTANEPSHVFATGVTKASRIVLCVGTTSKFKVLRWTAGQMCFIPVKEVSISAPCSCIHFSSHSVIFGSDKFYEMDLGDLSVEEFLDPSDSSLSHILFGVRRLNSFPIDILDVGTQSEPEFLLCFNEIGVFVNKFGQRSREDDVKWSHLPLAFAFRRPYLFTFFFSSLAVIKLTYDSFRKSKDDTDSSSATNLPDQKIIEFNNLRYLGLSNKTDAVYLSWMAKNGLEVVHVEGSAVYCNSMEASSSVSSLSERDGADMNDYAGSEFSFTSSIEKSLENHLHAECESDSGEKERVVRFEDRA